MISTAYSLSGSKSDTVFTAFKAQTQLGNGTAQRNICLYHWKGIGGAKKSNKIAREWCQKAVDGGYGKANALLQRIGLD